MNVKRCLQLLLLLSLTKLTHMSHWLRKRRRLAGGAKSFMPLYLPMTRLPAWRSEWQASFRLR